MLEEKETTTKKYISLMEATQSCNYSQEYLSLRARQGKLKSVKVGRNWFTTKEWLEEYLQHNGNGDYTYPPPDNLPVAPENFSPGKSLKRTLILSPRISFIFALVFVLIIAGVIFGRRNLKEVSYDIASFTAPAKISAINYLQKSTKHLGGMQIFVGDKVVTIGDIAVDITGIAVDYGQWAFEPIG